ncbi:ABC transporter permease [Bacillus cereus group sp. MYBK30-1]|uniref:ABC transporter permease n=1 Tax=unclassified Bacillus cereus group TaxID=2750818 RepID=UPI003F79D146
MSQLFRYLFNCNKKKIAIIYFGFITISLILFFNMKGISGVRISDRQDIIIIIFLIVLSISGFSLLLTGVSSFRKMLKNSMLRYTAISSQKYICANILFFALLFTILFAIGIIFLHYFSLNIYERKTDLGVREFFHDLYNYGMFHHVLSVFLWGIDFVNLLVSIYFIIVLTKLLNVKSSLNKVVFFILFLMYGALNGFVLYVLERIEKSGLIMKNVGFIDKNGFFDTSFYPGDGLTVFSLCFNSLLIFVLIVVTGRIIDKKLEV